jgi:hypothetical protein
MKIIASIPQNTGGVIAHISSYGHLPGFGCNRSQNAELSDSRQP